MRKQASYSGIGASGEEQQRFVWLADVAHGSSPMRCNKDVTSHYDMLPTAI